MGSVRNVRCVAAAGVMLLAAATVLCDRQKPWFVKNHFPESLPGLTRKDVNANQHWKMPRHAVLGENVTWSLIRAQYESQDPDGAGSLSIQMHYYPREGDALAMFDNMVDRHRLRRHVKGLPGRVNREVLSKSLERRTVTSATYDHDEGQYNSRRVVCRAKYLIDIWATGTRQAWSSNGQFLSAVNAAEQAAYGAIRQAGGRLDSDDVNLTVRHVHPFEEPIPEGLAPGDIIVTVTNKSGKPLAGREVVFTIDDYDPAAPILRMPYGAEGAEPAVAPYLPAGVDRRAWISDFTDERGRAVVNYIHGGGFEPLMRYARLARRLLRERKVRVPVVAVVLDRTLDEAFRSKRAAVAEATARVSLEFSHVAQVVGIGSKLMGETPDPEVTVEARLLPRPLESRVPVEVLRANPFGLNKGDVIRIRDNCIVHLEWLNGLRMVVIPKEGWLKGNDYATLTICPTDAGAYRRYSAAFNDKWTGLGVSGTGLTVGVVSPPAGTLTSAVTAVTGFLWSWYEQEFDPFLVEMHSRLVLESGKEVSLYTFEGAAKVYRPGVVAPAEVPAGKMLTVPALSVLPQAVAFETDRLDQGILSVDDELKTVAAGPARRSAFHEAVDRGRRQSSVGVIVGISLGAMAGVGVLLAVVLVMRRQRLAR
jgi:hypothetical protein